MPDTPARVLERLLGAASMEVSPGNMRAVAALRERFAPCSQVFINFLPDTEHRVVVETAAALRTAGFEPVPHIVARAVASDAALDGFLGRLSGEANVRRVLLIAGDHAKAAGPYTQSLDVIQSGLLQKHGVGTIAVAGHPEGHPAVDSRTMEGALVAKVKAAREDGLDVSIVSQFGFDAAPVLAWLARLRELGVEALVRIGVAGPASVATLVKYSMRCGVGNSLRVLKSRPSIVGLLGKAGPDDFLRDLTAGLAVLPDVAVEGLHFFPFGGIGETTGFISQALARPVAVSPQ